jgi:two-component system KDP operon response regulator KdpE
LTSQLPDAVVLDLGLPDQDGLVVFQQIRARASLPIVILSGDASEDRKVVALDGGADDYMTKPFGIRELDARLRGALRRHGGEAPRADTPSAEIIAGVLRINTADRAAWWRGKELHLTPKEFDFLACLASQVGRICSRQVLLEWVWGRGYTNEHHYLKVYAYRLRKKLGDDDGAILRSELSIGYRLVPPES